MQVKYIGSKPDGMPVYEPVGQKPRRTSAIKAVLKPGEALDVSEEEAKALVALDPKNFAIGGDASKPAVVAESGEQSEDVASEDEPKEEVAEKPKKRRRGRPKKGE